MTDYFALALGHALLAVAFLRLVMRDELDEDPKIKGIKDSLNTRREQSSVIGRNARRRRNAALASAEDAQEDSD